MILELQWDDPERVSLFDMTIVPGFPRCQTVMKSCGKCMNSRGSEPIGLIMNQNLRPELKFCHDRQSVLVLDYVQRSVCVLQTART